MSETPAIYCMATNTLPGGTERHVQQRAGEIRAVGGRVVLLRYTGVSATLEPDGAPNSSFALPDQHSELKQALAALDVHRIHIHQIVDAPLEIFDLGIPFELSVHDYGWICPQVTLLDKTREYCGEPPDVEACEICYRELRTHKDWASLRTRSRSVAEMRRQNIGFLEQAELVHFPSLDAANRIARYARMRQAVVEPPQVIAPSPRRWRRNAEEAVEPARVAYIGSLGYAKGFYSLYALALDRLKRGLPIEFHVIGGSADSAPLLDLGVKVHGPYAEDEVHDLIGFVRPHLAIFPGVLPETFSYTLSIAFEHGIWPIAYDLGAIADRIRNTGFGTLLPQGTPAHEVNDKILEMG